MTDVCSLTTCGKLKALSGCQKLYEVGQPKLKTIGYKVSKFSNYVRLTFFKWLYGIPHLHSFTLEGGTFFIQ